MLSAPGIGSGLDVNGIVSQLMTLERRPLQQLESRQEALQAQISANGQLKSALTRLLDAARALGGNASTSPYKAVSSNENVFSATAGAGAASEGHSIKVIDLAQAHRIASGSFPDADAVVGTGTLTIGVGPDSFDVVIDSSKQTLAGIRDAINTSADNTGVTATIINVDGGSRLVLTAQDGGTANTLTVSGLSALNFTEVDPANDAVLEVDGFQVTRASNTLSDVLSGVTLQLKGQGDAELSIVADTDSYTKAAQELVDAYNALRDTIGSLRQGPLRGDTLMLSLESKLRQAFSSQVSGLMADFSYAVELGLSFDRNGVLSLNRTKLESAMATDFDSIVALFGRQDDGLAALLDNVLDSYMGSGGLIDNRNQGLNGQIRSLDQRIDSYEYRLTQIEERYRRQFSALDGLLGELQSTSSFLSQQLKNLPFSQGNKT